MVDQSKPQEAARGLLTRGWQRVSDILAAVLTLLAIGWAVSFQRTIGLDIYPQQFFAAMLAITLALAFCTLPAKRNELRQTVPWYDAGFALVSLIAVGYVAVKYPDLVLMIFARPIELWLPSILIVVLTLEALRRASGWALVIIILAFFCYAAVDSHGILGLPMSVATTIVVAFILFGVLLGITGGTSFFTDAAMIGMGRFRGGSMKIAVLASGLFGSISGSAVANVVGTGVVTIPMIKNDGYPAHRAGAIEAVASTGGQLMPPVMGASAFLMAEFLAVPYSDIVSAALVPALLYYIALFIQADLEAARLGIRAVSKEKIPSARRVFGGLHFVAAFAVLIYLLFWQRYQPERAALWAAVALIFTALVLGYGGVRPTLKQILASLSKTGHSVVEILLISAASGFVIGVLNITGLSFNLTYLLVQVGGTSLILLLFLSAVVCIILGMGLPTLGVYVLLAALVAPALIQLGVEPIAAHLYVRYFGMMSMITPPIALAAFAAASIAKSPSMATGIASMRFGWTAYLIPILFVFSPSLILVGTSGDIAFTILTAGFGVWLVSASLAGYFSGPLSMPIRVLFSISGLMALIPAEAFSGAFFTDIAGVALGIALMVHDAMKNRRGMNA
ncbi:MAG: TRAP transporter fused permease subunit [Paracoccaceae bacterium]